MRHICVSESEPHGSDESFVFWWFSGEVFAHESYFINSSFPALSLSLSRSNDFEHLGLCHWIDFLDRDWPFSCFFFSFLLDHIGQHLWVSLLLSIHQIGRHGSLLNVFNSALCIFLFVLFDRLFHLYFLLESLLIEDLGLESSQSLCLFGDDFSLPSILFPPLFFRIQSLTEPFLM